MILNYCVFMDFVLFISVALVLPTRLSLLWKKWCFFRAPSLSTTIIAKDLQRCFRFSKLRQLTYFQYIKIIVSWSNLMKPLEVVSFHIWCKQLHCLHFEKKDTALINSESWLKKLPFGCASNYYNSPSFTYYRKWLNPRPLFLSKKSMFMIIQNNNWSECVS
jgi:hypothetical protein